MAFGGGAGQTVDGRRVASAAGGCRSIVDFEEWGDENGAPRASAPSEGGRVDGRLAASAPPSDGDRGEVEAPLLAQLVREAAAESGAELCSDGGGGGLPAAAAEVATIKAMLRRQREVDRGAAAAKRSRLRRRRQRSREKALDAAIAGAAQVSSAECGTAVEAALNKLKTMFKAGFDAAAEPNLPFEVRRLRVLEVASGFQEVCINIVPDNLAPLRADMRQWLDAETRRVLGAGVAQG